MSEYKRPNFDQKWWQDVSKFLKENPQVGFREDDVKQFIKFCVNRKMQEIDNDLEQLRKIAKDLPAD